MKVAKLISTTLLALAALAFQTACLNVVEVTVTISPVVPMLVANDTQVFSASGGSPDYVYSIVSGNGSINASTGVFTAPSTAGETIVRVSDAARNTADATVTTAATLTLSPAVKAVIVSASTQLSVTGGYPPYTYSVAGSGTIDSSGLYTGAAAYGRGVVTVTDSQNNTDTASLYSITQMQLWLDASAITGVADGAQFGTWNDISGSGNHATQPNAAWRPFFFDNNVSCAGTQDCVAIGNTTWMYAPEILTAGEFMSVTVGQFPSGYLLADDTSGLRNLSVAISNIGGIDKYLLTVTDAAGATISASAGDTTAPGIISAQARNQGGSISFNGTSASQTTPAFVPGAFDTSNIVLGPTWGLGAGVSQMSEAFLFTTVMTAATKMNLECYLSEKYDILTSHACDHY